MKTLITLKDTQEAKELMDELDFDELKENLDFVYPSKLDITLKGSYYLSVSIGCLWIETDDFILLRVPLNLIHGFIVKEGK